MARSLFIVAALGLSQPALADRIPVAVFWMGDPSTVDEASRAVGAVNGALARSSLARPLDSESDRRVLVEGGPETAIAAAIASGQAAFAKLQYAEAAHAYEEAERLLLTAVPVASARDQLSSVERGLLAAYDQLNRPREAARAAERLSWLPGSNEDLAPLLQRHIYRRPSEPNGAVTITSTPPGAAVYRNLQLVGATPVSIAGGDEGVDIVDVEAAGFRRFHQELGASPVVAVLRPEEGLGAQVDAVRAQAPDAPPAEVAELGRRVGAAVVLVLLPDGAEHLLARSLDVNKKTWKAEALRVDLTKPDATERLMAYLAPAPVATAKPVVVALPPAPPEQQKKKWHWGKWYTWVAAGAVAAIVGGLIIIQNVGSDKLTVTATH